jgi:hypothetical protein
MVGLGRVELPTRSLGNCCSIHLSYSPDLHKSLSRIRWLGQVTETTSKDETDAQRIKKGAQAGRQVRIVKSFWFDSEFCFERGGRLECDAALSIVPAAKQVAENPISVSFRGAACPERTEGSDEESLFFLASCAERFLASLGMTAGKTFSANCKAEFKRGRLRPG